MGFFDFISDAVKDVPSVVTAPISAVTSAILGGAAKILAPVADVVKTGMGDATQVATGAQNMISGTVTGVAHQAEQVLQPLSAGIVGGIKDIGHGVGGGIQAVGSGVGGGIKGVGDGIGETAEWLPIAAVGGLGLVLLMENSSNKRGGSFIGDTAKRMRLS